MQKLIFNIDSYYISSKLSKDFALDDSCMRIITLFIYPFLFIMPLSDNNSTNVSILIFNSSSGSSSFDSTSLALFLSFLEVAMEFFFEDSFIKYNKIS